ncbi:hypothetical protein SAMN05428987_3108 [Paenibacillus sp. CF095]|nr:hypothetical protein SAMN05428987_3108 [Paenibacillus sp. CF095]
MLHEIFQRHHIPPDEIFVKPARHRAVIYASMAIVLEDEERARKIAERGR